MLTVKTGMGEYLPGAMSSLTRLDLGHDHDLYRCPECDSLFHWQDHPQFYGSGNLDEESIARLSDDEAAAVRSLLSFERGSENADQILRSAFAIVPREIVSNILMRLAIYKAAEFDPLVDVVVDRLLETNDTALTDVLSTYCGRNNERIAHMIDRINNDPRPKGNYVNYALLMLGQKTETAHGEKGQG